MIKAFIGRMDVYFYIEMYFILSLIRKKHFPYKGHPTKDYIINCYGTIKILLVSLHSFIIKCFLQGHTYTAIMVSSIPILNSYHKFHVGY